jgi:hypothetical protein
VLAALEVLSFSSPLSSSVDLRFFIRLSSLEGAGDGAELPKARVDLRFVGIAVVTGGALGAVVVPPTENEKLAESAGADVPKLKGAFDESNGVCGFSVSSFFSDSSSSVVLDASSFASLGIPKENPVGLGAST